MLKIHFIFRKISYDFFVLRVMVFSQQIVSS